jgi:hypothetical protein
MGYIAGMILSGIASGATSAVVGRYAAKDNTNQWRKKSIASSVKPSTTQASQQQAAQGAQKPNQGKNDTLQELERLGNLKKQGLLTDEEFQTMKTRLISNA